MSRHRVRSLSTFAAVALAFAAGRYLPANQADAAPAVPVELYHDGSTLWAAAVDPNRPILVQGWAKGDWSGLPANEPVRILAKNGNLGVPVPVAVSGIGWAKVYELRAVGVWDLENGFRPCLGDPIECEWLPLPPLPPRPPQTMTHGLVPYGP